MESVTTRTAFIAIRDTASTSRRWKAGFQKHWKDAKSVGDSRGNRDLRVSERKANASGRTAGHVIPPDL